MSVELIAIIAASIALTTVMGASLRGLRQELRDSHRILLDRISAIERNLRADMQTMRSGLRAEMQPGVKDSPRGWPASETACRRSQE